MTTNSYGACVNCWRGDALSRWRRQAVVAGIGVVTARLPVLRGIVAGNGDVGHDPSVGELPGISTPLEVVDVAALASGHLATDQRMHDEKRFAPAFVAVDVKD